MEEPGRRFADQYGATFVKTYEEVCAHPDVDFVDVCTFPDFRLQPLEMCAKYGKHIQVQKPMSTNAGDGAQDDRDGAQGRHSAGRREPASVRRFQPVPAYQAIAAGRLGKLLQCDCYVKWYRSAQYYSRPIKGSWATEGGGALINQAIHQLDILRWLAGPVAELFGYWQLGALHKIESEDVVNALVRYRNGATGVIQASTAFWPGYTERTEFHGTKGTAIISGDKLTTWDVENDSGPPAPVEKEVASGASDPMAISLTPFERQFLDFGAAIRDKRKPLVAGEDGCQALEIVDAVYRSCRTGEKVALGS